MSETFETLDNLQIGLARLHEQADWPALITRAERVRAIHPQAWLPIFFLAQGLIQTGRYDAADQELLAAMDRFPREPALAVLYGQAGGRLSKGEAIARWRGVQRRLPDVPDPYLGLIGALTAARRHDDVDQVLADALARLPNRIELLIARAQASWARQNWAATLADWTVVHDRAPENDAAVTFMVRALAQLQRYDEADALARPALARRHDDFELSMADATTAGLRGDLNEAVRRWRRTHAMRPGHAMVTLGLARALVAAGHPQEAEAALRIGLEHDPRSQVLLDDYAAMATTAEQWPEAVRRWKAMYDLCPPQVRTYLEYAGVLQKAGMIAEAEEIVSEGMGFAPDNYPLYRRHADLPAERGDATTAIARWQAAETLFPGKGANAQGLKRAERALAREQRLIDRDNTLLNKAPKTTTIEAPREVIANRIAPTGPTALDRLLSGAPAAELAIQPRDPAPTGLLGRLKARLTGS